MKLMIRGILICGTLFLSLLATTRADVLELRDGQVLRGKYAGGTAATVRFDTTAGTQAVDVSQIVTLTFTGSTTGAGAAVNSSAPVTGSTRIGTTPPAQSGSVTLPAGTQLLVRLSDNLSSQSEPGSIFSGKLETDLVQNGVKVAPAGTPVYGKVASATQARRAVGQSTLDITLTQLAVGGNSIPIVTSGYQQAGERAVRQTARGAAGGAAIGGIAGDAGKGAGIGAAAGAARRGQTITIPSGTLLEFTLAQPVNVQPAQPTQ